MYQSFQIQTLGLCLSSAALIYLSLTLFFSTKKENLRTKKEKKKLTYQSLNQMIEEKAQKTSIEAQERYYINTITKRKQTLSYRFKSKILGVIYNEFNTISLTTFMLASIGSAAIGIYVSTIFNNFIVTVLFFFGFMMVPYLIISHYNNTQRSKKDKKLQMVMGNLSTAYIRSTTFLQAVESNIDIIPAPLQKDFQYYIRSVKYLQSDQFEAMIELRDKINNAYFSKFINLAINAEMGEKSLKYTIMNIPHDYKRYIDINEEFAREVRDKNKIFLIVLSCFPFTLGIIRIMSSYYYSILTNTFFGKTAVTMVIVILGITSALFIRINKPVKLKL